MSHMAPRRPASQASTKDKNHFPKEQLSHAYDKPLTNLFEERARAISLLTLDVGHRKKS